MPLDTRDLDFSGVYTQFGKYLFKQGAAKLKCYQLTKTLFWEF